jgi:hypothetical protein
VVVSDEGQPLPVLGPAGREWEDPLVAYRADALPRVFWAGAWEVVPDERVMGPLVGASAGDRVILADPPPGLGPSGAPEGPVPAADVKVEARSLSATVSAPRPGLAVVLDPFFPGWSATVDGVPAPVVRADFAFLAVPVPEGRHALRLRYENHWVAWGWGTTGVVLGLLVLVLAWRRRVPDAP